ncbi:MAG TPA: fluoride efflux transporter CrcB [Gaiellaceae bacterium]|nr:fluoride efflux transporter CrcB [Gaiellaceae bacterium]
MPVIVGVALGGALGASARYALDRFIEEHTESVFPWATFTINVTGCLLIGILTEQLVDRHHLPAWIRVGVIVGVIGGYTTFSTFSQESYALVDSHEVGVALTYMVGSVALGVLAVYAGTLLGRSF